MTLLTNKYLLTVTGQGEPVQQVVEVNKFESADALGAAMCAQLGGWDYRVELLEEPKRYDIR